MANDISEKMAVNLPDELNFWAVRVFERVKRYFVQFEVNRMRGEKGSQYTGDLYRTIHWKVHNAANGNPAMIQFFYMKYGDFVQWGVGSDQKLWNIPQTGEMGPILAPNGKRKAKQFIRREVMYHAKWLLKRLAEQYCYWGNLYIVRGLSEGMGDPKIMNDWINEHRDQLSRGFLSLADVK